ncbi:F-box/kelch-repeat protein At3g06240-like [Cornus florida]|uniref:F-box/kelch-repeat protein At3g06240-like n=1 Tax=Cornus florida TaxID=4283 RepID=UPI00289C8B3D|nr:F-box/kelch-repeat protein At3g06240-like [Cornus florida]
MPVMSYSACAKVIVNGVHVPDFHYKPIIGTDSFSVGVPVNGSLHWLAHKCSEDSPYVKLYVICAFDVTNEKFRDLLVPCPLHKSSDFLVVIGGCLAMLVCPDYGDINVWVMKEYGVTDTWTKFLTINSWSYCRTPVIISMVDGMVRLDIDGNELVAYNSEEVESRYIRVHGIPSKFRAKKTRVESLISPNYERYEGIENSRKR